MRKGIVIALSVIIFMSCVIYILGCSSGSSGMPNVDIPDFPTETSGDTVNGSWTGTWGSYQAGGPAGTTEPLELTQSDAGDGTYTLSGTLKMTGYTAFEGETGTVTGTLSGTNIDFTATFGTRTMVFDGTVTGSSMSGTYKIYESEIETDTGSFVLNKQ